jgi:hypothetical protein
VLEPTMSLGNRLTCLACNHHWTEPQGGPTIVDCPNCGQAVRVPDEDDILELRRSEAAESRRHERSEVDAAKTWLPLGLRTRAYGATEHIPGLFYVTTVFVHVFFLPVIPLRSYLVNEHTREALPLRALGLPSIHGKSMLLGFLRGWLSVATIASALLATFIAYNNLSGRELSDLIVWAGGGIVCVVLFGVVLAGPRTIALALLGFLFLISAGIGYVAYSGVASRNLGHPEDALVVLPWLPVPIILALLVQGLRPFSRPTQEFALRIGGLVEKVGWGISQEDVRCYFGAAPQPAHGGAAGRTKRGRCND